MTDIETFVRLKYQIATGRPSWDKLSETYPEEVREIVGERYHKWQSDTYNFSNHFTVIEQWDMYLGWLVEELCKWESKQNT